MMIKELTVFTVKWLRRQMFRRSGSHCNPSQGRFGYNIARFGFQPLVCNIAVFINFAEARQRRAWKGTLWAQFVRDSWKKHRQSAEGGQNYYRKFFALKRGCICLWGRCDSVDGEREDIEELASSIESAIGESAQKPWGWRGDRWVLVVTEKPGALIWSQVCRTTSREESFLDRWRFGRRIK